MPGAKAPAVQRAFCVPETVPVFQLTASEYLIELC